MFTELLDSLHSVGVEGELVAVVLALLIVLSALYLIYRLLPTRRLTEEDAATLIPRDPNTRLIEAILQLSTAFNEGNEQSKLIIQGFSEMNARFAEMIALSRQQNETLAAAIAEMHTTRATRETQAGDTIATLMGIAKRQEHNIMPGIDASLGGIRLIRDDIAQIDARVKVLPTADALAVIQDELTRIRHRVDEVLEVVRLLETRPTELPEPIENHHEADELKPDAAVPQTPETTADASAQSEHASEEIG